MDEQLAAIYGTGQSVDESDLEKTAAAELLVKLAEEQGLDLNDFSDEEVGSMLSDLYGGGIEHTAQEVQDEEAQEKFAEADYLGRIMAHSMVQELNNIEKEAGAKDVVKSVGAFLKSRPKAYAGAGKAMKEALTGKQKGLFDPLHVGTRFKRGGKALRKVAPELAAAGTLAAGGTIAAKKYKSKEKGASALETLAEQRAYELAKEAGYIVEDNFGKEASALDYEVERRALEICEANGIPVEWNE